MDLYANRHYEFQTKDHVVEIHTGTYVAIPEGFYGQLSLRSGWSTKNQVVMHNAPGIIDCDYRGEIICRVECLNPYRIVELSKGEKFAQLVILPLPRVDLVQVEELPTTERGEGGFGSTGK